ncbi:MAG: exo-alpha-sialidase [Chloroflexi bacterium]|nr:exo-alpha-sialidase [Chloroflexota bacterium]
MTTVATDIWKKVILKPTAELPRRQEASAVELHDGGLLLAWSEFRGRGDNARATIEAMVSYDRGETWDAQWRIVENTAGLNVMSPAVRRLADGGLGMVYSHRDSTSDATRMFVRSDDEGKTWSPPVRLPQEEPYTTGCHDRLAVLDGGRLVAPLHCTHDWHAHHLAVRCAWSDDNGRTWRLSHAIELPKVSDSGESGCIEPDVAQRVDGSLLMAIRTAMGTVFRAESHDGGETWTGLRSMEVVAPVAPSLLRRIPGTDDLLLIWNWHYNWRERLAGARHKLACAVSTDGGDSWPLHRRKILENDPELSASYPTCTFIGPNLDEAFITYRWGGHITRRHDPDDPAGWIGSKAARFPLSWLYEAGA